MTLLGDLVSSCSGARINVAQYVVSYCMNIHLEKEMYTYCVIPRVVITVMYSVVTVNLGMYDAKQWVIL